MIDENKEQVTSQLREKKDELLEKADAAIKPSRDETSGSPSTAGTPFMAGR